jgi:hypothetical protein
MWNSIALNVIIVAFVLVVILEVPILIVDLGGQMSGFRDAVAGLVQAQLQQQDEAMVAATNAAVAGLYVNNDERIMKNLIRLDESHRALLKEYREDGLGPTDTEWVKAVKYHEEMREIFKKSAERRQFV